MSQSALDAVAQVEAGIDRLVALGPSPGPLGDLSSVVRRLEVLRDRLSGVAASWLAEFGRRGGPAAEESPSAASWLAAVSRRRRSTAGADELLARKLARMPLVAAALAAGEVTADHARVLAAALNPRTASAFAEQEAELVGHARRLSADDLGQLVAAWLRRFDPDGPAPAPERDVFHLSAGLDGRLHGRLDLGGDLAATVGAVLREATEELWRSESAAAAADSGESGDRGDRRAEQPTSQRRARALGVVCERAAGAPGNPARRLPLLVLHADVPSLAGSADADAVRLAVEDQWAAAVDPDVARQWACDAHISRLVLDARGAVLDAGTEVRTANRALRRALAGRDGGCVVPGCGRPPGWCDAHHVVHWVDGGPTAIGNLVLLCRWHHRSVHAGRLVIRMVRGRPVVTRPDGSRLPHDRGPAP